MSGERRTCKCGAIPINPANGLCASCEDEVASPPLKDQVMTLKSEPERIRYICANTDSSTLPLDGDVVERVARAICEADCGQITDNELARCRDLAVAALTATRSGDGELRARMERVASDLETMRDKCTDKNGVERGNHAAFTVAVDRLRAALSSSGDGDDAR